MDTKKLKTLLEKRDKDSNSSDTESKPIIYNKDSFKDLLKFIDKNPHITIQDHFEEQLEELFNSRNPSLIPNSSEATKNLKIFKSRYLNKEGNYYNSGSWVHLPWQKKLIHIVNKDEFFELRTTRNRNLITKKEQKTFENTVVGVSGLSIGNSVALSVAISGGSNTMKIADPDTLSTSNLNRLKIGLDHLGINKTVIAAQQIYEINPYANLILYKEGLDSKNIEEFFLGPPKIDIFIDEMDNFLLKIYSRLVARSLKIPVLMTTDNGDDILVDIDRFDIEQNKPPFDHLPNMTLEQIVSNLSKATIPHLTISERVSFAANFIGPHLIHHKMQKTIPNLGVDLVSWPQLGTAAFIGGAIVAYLIKKISLKESLVSGKHPVSLDSIFIKDFNSIENKTRRKVETEEFIKSISNSSINLKSIIGI